MITKITLQGLQTDRVLKALLGHLHRVDHMHFSTAGFVSLFVVLFCYCFVLFEYALSLHVVLDQ